MAGRLARTTCTRAVASARGHRPRRPAPLPRTARLRQRRLVRGFAGRAPAGHRGRPGPAARAAAARPLPLPVEVTADRGGRDVRADGAPVLTATRVDADLRGARPGRPAPPPSGRPAASTAWATTRSPPASSAVPTGCPATGCGSRPGWLDDRDEETACAWVPDDSVDLAQTWAAMDCPGGWSGGLAGRPMVLGTMTARVERPAAPRRALRGGRPAPRHRRPQDPLGRDALVGRLAGRPRATRAARHRRARLDPGRPGLVRAADGAGRAAVRARSGPQHPQVGGCGVDAELGAQPGEVELAADAEVAHHVAGERRGLAGAPRARDAARAPSPARGPPGTAGAPAAAPARWRRGTPGRGRRRGAAARRRRR